MTELLCALALDVRGGLPPLLAEQALAVPWEKWRKGRDILAFSFNGNAKMTVEVHVNSEVGPGTQISKWLSVLEA